MKSEMKNLRWNALLGAALYIAFGLVCIILPDQMLLTLGKILGWSVIVAGILFIIAYLVRDAKENYFRNDFLHGMIAITAGIVILRNLNIVIDLIPVLFGALVAISGCMKLQTAIDLKRMNVGNWIAELVLALVVLVFGIVLVANPFKAMTTLLKLIGVGLVIGGVTDLISTLYFTKKVDDAMQAPFREVSSEPVEDETNGEDKTSEE
jgi:uncharacterized membrane protein HdeD (DUF308 family)